jgi:hypothetical protein
MLSTVIVNEYLLHGADMASAVGRQWSCPESAADTAFGLMAPLLVPYVFDSEVAGTLDGSFALGGTGGRLCYQVHSGTIEPVDPETDADCSISGPSSQWLLWLGGRAEWEDAGLSASGPRAELAPRFAASFPRRNL